MENGAPYTIVGINDGFLHIRAITNTPVFDHIHLVRSISGQLGLTSNSFRVKKYEGAIDYKSIAEKYEIDENHFLIEFQYIEDTTRVAFFKENLEWLPKHLKAEFRDLRIKQILE